MNNTNTDQPWWQRILMGGAIAENPSVMTAAGHKIEKDGTVTVDNQNDAEVEQLRKSLPVIGAAAIAGTAVANPATYPWVAKNVVLPVLGGEVVNEATRKISNNYYRDFGDWLYRSTPLERWTKGTWAETPTKFVADMTNPGYWAPYGKIVKGFNNIVPTITKTYSKPVKINSTPRGALRYWANPNGKSAIEIANTPTVGNFKAKEFAKNHYGDNVLKYGKKTIQTSKDIYKTYKQNKLAKQYIRNIGISPSIYYRGKDINKRINASLQNLYSRDRYIENNLEYGPTQYIVDSSLENSMLINGSNVATGIIPKEGGIVYGSSRPHFENGYYVPAKGTVHLKTGETLTEELHPIFFSTNKPFGELPHGKSFTSTYKEFYPDNISNPNTQKNLNSYRKYILDKIKTSDNVPYRFVETPYKLHLNAKPRETSWGIEVHVPKVLIEDIRGHEYDPVLKTFRKHLYVDPNMQVPIDNSILKFNILKNGEIYK